MDIHENKPRIVCVTEKDIGPKESFNPKEIVLDTTKNVIPLWNFVADHSGQKTPQTLLWTFHPSSVPSTSQRQKVKDGFAKASQAWEWTPVKFQYTDSNRAHFQVFVSPRPKFVGNGVVLASAFFPNAVSTFIIYPHAFMYGDASFISTLEHEIGHCFGRDITLERKKEMLFCTTIILIIPNLS
jgi:hypothetical protein